MISTYLENGCIRIGMDVPALCETCCPGHDVNYELPIVVVGDSSRSVPWRLIQTMVDRQRFILDLLLINGTCNRYFDVTVDSSGRMNVECLSGVDKPGASDVIHQRATLLHAVLSRNLDGCHVLTTAQEYAVKNGIAIEQRKANG